MNLLAASRLSDRLPSLTLALALAVAAGCGKRAEPPAGPMRPDLGPKVTDYRLRGVVRKIEKELSHVRIAHERIPDFMPAMEMRFLYKDRELLEELEPGDLVEGTLRVERAEGAVIDYELLGLKVTKPAPAPRLVLDTAKGEVRPGARPSQLEIGGVVPDFTMTTQEGKSMKLSELRSDVVILTFIYTRCPMPDFCPLMDRKFAELARQIASYPGRARQVRLISLSFDPDHDTPDVLRKHAQMRGAEPPLWTYAVASHQELAKIAPPLGLFYAPGDREIAHNLCTAVIDRHQKLARLELGSERNKWTATDLLKTVNSLLPGAGSAPK
jgi:protein SCO1/2